MKKKLFLSIIIPSLAVLLAVLLTDIFYPNNRSALIIVILLGIFLMVISAALLSRSLFKPFDTLDLDHPLSNETYPELMPLLTRLEEQQGSIRDQLTTISEKQEEFFQITEAMNDGLVTINPEGMILNINRAAKHFFDTDQTEGYFGVVSKSHDVYSALNTALKGETTVWRTTKNEHTYELSACPVVISDAQYAAVLFIHDISKRQKAEQSRREFSANVSHELKTPLTSIMGYSEIIEAGIAKKEDISHFAGKINAEANRLLTLIQDIIYISRLEESDLSDAFTMVDLNDLCREISEKLQKKAEHFSVTLQLDGDAPAVSGVPGTLYEMIYNLVDNAITYNHPGGHVELLPSEENQKSIIKVKDDGIGIPKEHQSRIFERFYRVDKSRSRESGGTGLGLSIVKHGALMHNAEIRLDSEPGKGSEFTLIF